MDPHSFIARAEAQRWVGIAEKLLMGHDLVGSKTFAIRARDSDPRLEAADQILAIADTLLAAEKRVVGNNGAHQPDFYAILQLVRFVQDAEHIASQYRRLAVLLNPHQNRFPYSDQAFQLVNDAWAVLSNPMRKSMYDEELDFPPQQQQMDSIGFNLEQQHQHQQQQHQHQHQQQHQHNFFSINRMGAGHEQELPEQQQTFQTRLQQSHQQQQLQQHNFLSQPNPVRPLPVREQEHLFHHREQEQLFQPQVQPFQVTSSSQQQTRTPPQPPQPQPPIQSPPRPQPAAQQPPFSWPQTPHLSQPQQQNQQQQKQIKQEQQLQQHIKQEQLQQLEQQKQQQQLEQQKQQQLQEQRRQQEQQKQQQLKQQQLKQELKQQQLQQEKLKQEQLQQEQLKQQQLLQEQRRQQEEQKQHQLLQEQRRQQEEQKQQQLLQEKLKQEQLQQEQLKQQQLLQEQRRQQEEHKQQQLLQEQLRQQEEQKQQQLLQEQRRQQEEQKQQQLLLEQHKQQQLLQEQQRLQEQQKQQQLKQEQQKQEQLLQEQRRQQEEQKQQLLEEQLRQQESIKQNAAPVQLSDQVNSSNGAREEENEAETETADEDSDDSPTFWTACPFCFYMYEYPRVYAECTLCCDNCKRAFQAVCISSPPPIIEGQDAYFYCWGFIPVGVRMSHLQNNNSKGTNSKWTPFSPFYDASNNAQNHLNCNAAPKENLFVNKSSGPRIYVDDITDDVFIDVSEPSDDSDFEWDSTKKQTLKRMKKGLNRGFKERVQVLALRAQDVRNGTVENLKHGILVQEGVKLPTLAVAETNMKALGTNPRKKSGRVAKEVGKLDLNVEFNNNEGEEPAPRMNGGNRGHGHGQGQGEEDNIGFFEGLDEFLSSLPILSVVNEEKVKA